MSINIEKGKTLIVRYLAMGDPHPDGTRTVFFELNGQPREVLVVDQSLVKGVATHPRAEPNNPLHIAAPMPGLVVRVAVAPAASPVPAEGCRVDGVEDRPLSVAGLVLGGLDVVVGLGLYRLRKEWLGIFLDIVPQVHRKGLGLEFIIPLSPVVWALQDHFSLGRHDGGYG